MSLDLEDAISAIQVAVTMGTEVMAPIGVSFYALDAHWYKDQLGDPVSIDIGYYQSELDAMQALYDKVISIYCDELSGPWLPTYDENNEQELSWEDYVTLMGEYLNTKTKEEFIKEYFGEDGGYTIKKVKIEGDLERLNNR